MQAFASGVPRSVSAHGGSADRGSSTLDLQLEAGKAGRQLSKVVDGWLMFGQPCGFTAPGPEGLEGSTAPAARIYLDCPAS